MGSLRYLNFVLTALTILLALQLWTTWSSAPADFIATPAYAQGIPDEGAQRKQIIDELKLLNRKVEEMKDLLGSGKVRVTVQNPSSDGK